jgi:hypothetical protein
MHIEKTQVTERDSLVKFLKKYGGYGAIILVLCLGLYLRVYDLTLDPPQTIGGSQDLVTDPPHVTSFAANKANYGKWELFPYAKWRVFKISLPSFLSYLLFSVGKPSIFWNNLAGAILSFIGILFLVWGVASGTTTRGKLLALVAAIFLAANFVLVTFNRAPFLESALIFYFGLIVLLYSKYGLDIKNILFIAFLVPLACLTGKVFGITIGAAVFGCLILGPEKNKLKKAILMVIGGFVSTGILLLILFGNHVTAYFAYILEQAFTGHGSSPLFKEIYTPIAILLSYGTATRLFRDSPFLFAAGYLAVAAALLYFRNCYYSFRNNQFMRFSLYWALTMFLLFFPANYRPLRYSLLIYIPVVLVIAAVMDINHTRKKSPPNVLSVLSTGALFLLNYFFLSHLVVDFIYCDAFPAGLWPVYKYLFPPAVILTALMIIKPAQKAFFRIIPRLKIVITILACCSLVYQVFVYHQWASQTCRSIENASKYLSEIVGTEAVLTGPHAPRLTLGSRRKHFIYCFGLEKPDTSIFDMFPITHLIVDAANRKMAFQDYPETVNAKKIAGYRIRSHFAEVLRLQALPPGYRLSDYELAEELLEQGKADSALILNRVFLQKYPDNMFAKIQLFRIGTKKADFESMLSALNDLYEQYPNDINAQFFCAINYKKLGLMFQRPDLIDISKTALERAKRSIYAVPERIQKRYDRTR